MAIKIDTINNKRIEKNACLLSCCGRDLRFMWNADTMLATSTCSFDWTYTVQPCLQRILRQIRADWMSVDAMFDKCVKRAGQGAWCVGYTPVFMGAGVLKQPLYGRYYPKCFGYFSFIK